MRRLSNEDIDAALLEVFGLQEDDLTTSRNQNHNLPDRLFHTILKVVDSAGIENLLDDWRAEDQPSPRGRKGLLPPRAIFMALLLNCYWREGYSYQALGETIAKRITPRQALQLGYDQSQGDRVDWYHRTWRSLHRIIQRVDGWHASSLGQKKTGPEHEQARALYDPERAKRCDVLGDRLIQESVKLLPANYLKNYRGDGALDSTYIPVLGRINPNDYGKKAMQKRAGLPKRDMLNVDDQMGWYTRTGSHDGSEKACSLPGYELDTFVMIDAKDGDFPFSLTTAVRFHRPGEIKVGPRETVEQHAALFNKRGILAVDRAFNGLTPEDFQEVVRKAGFETAYDYKSNELGPQGSVPGHPVIIVDGVPYVNRMPLLYRMITRWHAQGVIDDLTNEPYTLDTPNEIMQAREVYRMKAKGKIDKDGYQRFSYPNPSNYIAFDPVTDKSTQDTPRGSVTVKLDHETIKHLQKYPWQSEKWFRAYGQRSQVETSNARLKEADGENLGHAKLRTGRGHTYNYLMSIIATVVSNIRRIIAGIERVHATKPPASRARRRLDSKGVRLQHPQTATINTKDFTEAADPPTEALRE